VCLGPKRSGDIYTATELALLVAVASRLSDRLLHIDGARMAGEARALQAALRRYVPEAVAARVAEGEEVAPGEREVTVLFVDIRGYVGLVDGLSPRDVFSTVSRYAQLVSGVLCEHGGVVVEFSGDGMMAVFGAPVSLPRKERRAVEAAREIGRALGDAHPSAPGPPLAVGIGIATGPAFVGHVEAADRRIWSVIGHTTNLAARLQALSRELDAAIVVDATTHRAADYVCADFERARDVEIRGRRERLDLYYLPRAERSA
jgi:adenylate cyclase